MPDYLEEPEPEDDGIVRAPWDYETIHRLQMFQWTPWVDPYCCPNVPEHGSLAVFPDGLFCNRCAYLLKEVPREVVDSAHPHPRGIL